MLTQTLHCSHCGSDHLIRNGHAKNGKLRYRCAACQKYGRENPGSNAYSEKDKETILAAYHERTSIRGLRRIFGVSRNTVSDWLKKARQLPPLEKTALPAQPEETLELDELWSFVARRKRKRWVWLALCRRTRQIVAYAIGDRDRLTCRQLWERVPAPYKTGLLFTDFWDAYQTVLPEKQHVITAKGDGETNHIERFNNTLRQRLARFVRQTLSFSKSDGMHDDCLQLFLHQYNKLIYNRLSKEQIKERSD